MKFKKMMLVTLLLLAILTLGAVSASDGADAVTADDTVAEDVTLELPSVDGTSQTVGDGPDGLMQFLSLLDILGHNVVVSC